jgi:ribosomal protein S27E
MGDVNTSALACRDCGAGIVRANPRGRVPSLCEPCKLESRRRSIREYCRRRRAGVVPAGTYACVDCGLTGQRPTRQGPPPQRCPDCWKARERQRGVMRRAVIYGRLRARFEVEGRWSPCKVCGSRVQTLGQKGLTRGWCSPCWSERRRELDRQTRPRFRMIECRECGTVVRVTARQSRTARCSSCARQRRRELMRITNGRQYHIRRARKRGVDFESFLSEEIFQRDKWVCGVCRRRISRRLRHPHPMSASLDHVIPLSKGGSHTRANARAAHLRCNLRRYNRGGNEQLALIG